MNKSGDSILRGAREALAHARGDKTRGRTTFVRVPAHIDVKALRRQLGLSQEAFADRYGINVVTVQDWEQGRRRPSSAARVLLTVIAHEPEAIERALAAHELMPAVAADIRYATPRLPTG